MPPATLSDEERDALRATIDESARRGAKEGPDPASVRNVPLVAEDRDSERFCPAARRMMSRWIRGATHRLQRELGEETSVELETVVSADGKALRRELDSAWVGGLRTPAHDACARLCVNGAVIEALTAKMLGAEDVTDARQNPSAAALEMFDDVGRSMVYELADIWGEDQACDVELLDASTARSAVRELDGLRSVVVATVVIGGPVTGFVRLIAPPAAFERPESAAPSAHGVRPEVREAVAEVDVELIVELGRACVASQQVANLAVGSTLHLDQLVGQPLRLVLGGRERARVTPVLEGEHILVEVLDPEQLHTRSA